MKFHNLIKSLLLVFILYQIIHIYIKQTPNNAVSKQPQNNSVVNNIPMNYSTMNNSVVNNSTTNLSNYLDEEISKLKNS